MEWNGMEWDGMERKAIGLHLYPQWDWVTLKVQVWVSCKLILSKIVRLTQSGGHSDSEDEIVSHSESEIEIACTIHIDIHIVLQ